MICRCCNKEQLVSPSTMCSMCAAFYKSVHHELGSRAYYWSGDEMISCPPHNITSDEDRALYLFGCFGIVTQQFDKHGNPKPPPT